MRRDQYDLHAFMIKANNNTLNELEPLTAVSRMLGSLSPEHLAKLRFYWKALLLGLTPSEVNLFGRALFGYYILDFNTISEITMPNGRGAVWLVSIYLASLISESDRFLREPRMPPMLPQFYFRMVEGEFLEISFLISLLRTNSADFLVHILSKS